MAKKKRKRENETQKFEEITEFAKENKEAFKKRVFLWALKEGV
ncbi:MAG: hypothetical protein NZ805_15445 [Armatimonadetes bacterium]|nr:hypothetical protein [Armatimonadota bacterium]MDW8027259.1 hypothetical protein [Armatimonadota bacterium]